MRVCVCVCVCVCVYARACTGTHKYTGIQYICNFLKSISTILCMLLLSNELIIIDYNNNEYVY